MNFLISVEIFSGSISGNSVIVEIGRKFGRLRRAGAGNSACSGISNLLFLYLKLSSVFYSYSVVFLHDFFILLLILLITHFSFKPSNLVKVCVMMKDFRSIMYLYSKGFQPY